MKEQFPHFPLAELHAHLAASIRPSTYWQIAHDMGFKLPKKEYSEFKNYVTLSPERRTDMDSYFKSVYHPLLDKLSSGTHALEWAVYDIMSGAYRRNNITLVELRNNPMKHNNNAQLDLDHIIMAMLRGMERALLEYPNLSAGLIFCLDRNFTYEQNQIIVEKAIRYKRRGIVGIDIAGPGNPDFHVKDYASLIRHAKSNGLKVTCHTGETDDTNDMWEVVEHLSPMRIGHGIKAAYDKKLMGELAKKEIVLEVCPLSNIVLSAVENMDEMKFILNTFIENNVRFCINTDWPAMIENGNLSKQFALLLEKNILTEEQLRQCNDIAFTSSFIPSGGGLGVYL